MRKTFLFLIGALTALVCHAQKIYELASPDQKLKVTVCLSDITSYSVSYEGQTLLEDCCIGMEIEGRNLGLNPKVSRVTRNTMDERIVPTVPLKFSAVENCYNQLLLSFNGDYSIEFRAFNNGIAHRFITNIKQKVEIENETFRLNFPDRYLLHMQQPGGFKTAYEEEYSHLESDEWQANGKMALLPLLIDTRKGYKILLSESALTDYPAMFLKSTGLNGIEATFPKAPLAFEADGDRSVKITREARYIAKTPGQRGFPWRYLVIAGNDGELLQNTLTCQLAEKNVLEDCSWILPGQVSWEWWNGATPYGPDVNFKSGCNVETYKYYIDFAARYGIPYILMDEGWAQSTSDPYTPNPDVDLHELIRYGQEKNVGIILWLTWLTVEQNMDLFETFAGWGIKGVKIDFMDRSDQWMVNFYERVAREAAQHHLLVDFHGSFKPSGLEYKYPNVLSYEGVRGMEQMGGCRPDNSLYLPFIRNAVGAMDYTPGAMLSMQPETYRSERPNSASIGTRAYQMALYVVFESGLQMLADSPTMYYRNEECTQFITKVPVTWDETIALQAKAGEYAIVAKRKGDKWYIGGITNNREKLRSFDLCLDFLPEGRTMRMTSFEDGINADRQAMDYRKKERSVCKGDTITIQLARNGGFVASIE